jgi:serine/threonine-protein kinase RsbW
VEEFFMDHPPLTLTIPSDPRMLSVARTFVEAACQIAKLDKSHLHAVVLAAGEAFTNVIRHAHRNRPEAQIQIQCWIRPQTLELHFHDEGEPFDLNAVPHLNPGELRIGGRGVYLMRTLMDEVTCFPRAKGGNTLRMVKQLQSLVVRDCG